MADKTKLLDHQRMAIITVTQGGYKVFSDGFTKEQFLTILKTVMIEIESNITSTVSDSTVESTTESKP